MTKTAAPYMGPFDGTRFNAQPIEKRVQRSRIQLHSLFHTIQGEGPFTGKSAVFVRLAGCNLQCPMCDTEYTKNRIDTSAEGVVRRVKELPIQDGGLVVITGGEPFRQPEALHILCELLVDEGFVVQIETNGTFPVNNVTVGGMNHMIRTHVQLDSLGGVYIVVSPKTGKVHPSASVLACAYKYVLDHNNVSEDDGLPTVALGHTANPQLARPPKNRPNMPVYLQPCDTMDEVGNALNLQSVVASAMRFGYTAQLQTHKLMGLD